LSKAQQYHTKSRENQPSFEKNESAALNKFYQVRCHAMTAPAKCFQTLPSKPAAIDPPETDEIASSLWSHPSSFKRANRPAWNNIARQTQSQIENYTLPDFLRRRHCLPCELHEESPNARSTTFVVHNQEGYATHKGAGQLRPGRPL
jgi:hypothetical protein